VDDLKSVNYNSERKSKKAWSSWSLGWI